MKKIIITIKNCTDCPYYGHTGAFTKGGAKPCCDNNETVKLKGFDCFDRIIPYKVIECLGRTTRIPKKIPKWCPL